MNTPNNAIVVGIAADGSEAAVAYAVDVAKRRQRPLHLVHVLELPAASGYAALYGGVLETARATLDEALARAERLAGEDVVVTGELFDNGWIVDDLVRQTKGASLLVLEHRALSRVQRVFTRSRVKGVAGRAPVPVISVPAGWAPGATTTGVVTAAVQDPVEAPALLRAAFEEARARGARVEVLHAWWLASGYDVVVVDDAMRREWETRSREELAPVLKPLRAAYPDVPVTVTVQHAPPVEAVLDAAELSDLLVLGRRHHLLPLGSHLGPLSRAALDHAACPVLIAPELAVAAEPVSAPELAPAQP